MSVWTMEKFPEQRSLDFGSGLQDEMEIAGYRPYGVAHVLPVYIQVPSGFSSFLTRPKMLHMVNS